jgi:diguanylate cyclase (GGDEF)-like protein/putative nucleotidyltransferase with HDIG domain
MLLGRPLVLSSPATIRRLSVTDPDLIDAVVLTKNELLVNGKKPGRVLLLVWDAVGQSQEFDINVECEARAVPDQLLADLSGQPATSESPEEKKAWIYWIIVGSIALAGGTILIAKRRRGIGFHQLGLQTRSSNAAGTSQGAVAVMDGPHEAPAVGHSDEHDTAGRLTGLLACGSFMEAITEECRVSTRLARTFSVVLVDLDGFERISERGDHSEGERILAVAAKLLDARSRHPNLVTRYGRGKFAILLPETNTHQAEILAERLRAAVEMHAVLRAHGVTASIGIATFPDHGCNPEEVLKLADSGVQLARKCKGNCVNVPLPVLKPGNAERNERLLEKYLDLEAKGALSTAQNMGKGDLRTVLMTAPQENPLLDTVTALAFAVDAKGPYTTGHSQAVSKLAARIAIQAGLSVAEVEETRLAGLVHDIGKIQVPDSVCNKPGRLTPEEFEMVSRHSAWGAKMLEPLNVKAIEQIVRHHHERFDGQGYPDRLAADKIPLGARIVAVAESFHSMLSELPYEGARTFEDAVAELRRCSGLQFDPKIVMAFLDWIQSDRVSPKR